MNLYLCVGGGNLAGSGETASPHCPEGVLNKKGGTEGRIRRVVVVARVLGERVPWSKSERENGRIV